MAKGKNYLRLEFYAKDCNLAAARLAAAAFSAEKGFSVTDIEEIKVAVSESVSNAMIHGYGGDETRIVTLTLSAFENELEMVLIELKKIAQIIFNLFLLSNDDLECIERVKAMSEKGVDEDICELVLSNIFNVYKRTYGNPRPIVTDKVH